MLKLKYGEAVDLKVLELYRNERALEFFNQRWAETSEAVMFQHSWPALTGDENQDEWAPINSVSLRTVPKGKLYRSITKLGQRVLVIGTRLGPAIVYVARNERQGNVVRQFSSEGLIGAGFMAVPVFLDICAVRHILGTGANVSKMLVVKNIGEKIEAVYDHFTDPERHSLHLFGK